MNLVGTRSLKEGRETAGAKGLRSSPGLWASRSCGFQRKLQHRPPEQSKGTTKGSPSLASEQWIVPQWPALTSGVCYIRHFWVMFIHNWLLQHRDLISDSQVFYCCFHFIFKKPINRNSGKIVGSYSTASSTGEVSPLWLRGAPGPSKPPQFVYTQVSLLHHSSRVANSNALRDTESSERKQARRGPYWTGRIFPTQSSSWLLPLRNVWQCFRICQCFGRSWKPGMWHLPSPNLKTLNISRGNRTAQACAEKRCTPL